MKVGPSEPPCRRGLQTAISCFGPRTAVVNVMVKRRGVRSRPSVDRRDECKRSSDEASKTAKTTLKTRACTMSWDKHDYWSCGCPVYRRHDSYPGFRMELENRVGDAKGKGPSGKPMRPKVPMHWPGAHCFVVATRRGNTRGAKGAGHSRRDGVNG
jgi:hypothetical protein